jgi:hypothetical protein
MSTVRVGDVRIAIETDNVITTLDRLGAGAASSFVRGARTTLEGIRDEAKPRWPVRTGLSRDSFEVTTRINSGELAVSLLNTASNRWGPYPYKIRWSVRTKESLDAQKAKREAMIARGTSPAAQSAIRRSMRLNLWDLHGEGAPSAALAGKQPWRVLVKIPGEKQAIKLAIELQVELNTLAGRS